MAKLTSLTAPAALLLALAASIALAEPPIINPGAPGEPAKRLTAEEASRIASAGYALADVRFMQDMIPHHHQALEMAALVDERTNQPELVEIAGRIDASQADEIEFMKNWLAERGEDVPDPAAHGDMHITHEMAGMASPEQMAELAAAEGVEFDRLFLELMIRHHEGAIEMVEDLLELSGTAADPVLFEFTTDVTADQNAEIERMNALLASLSSDPRAGLAAGLHDAGEAIWNLELVAELPRPAGFFDPDNPKGLPAHRLEEHEAEEDGEGDDDAESESAGEADEAATDPRDEDEEEDERSPLLSFSNTDMAFDGDTLVVGNYHGFNIYDIANPKPELISSVVCPGGQGDVSIVGDLLIMSVEQTRARLDCGLSGTTEKISDERFMGLRIFDMSDRTMPVQVGAVQTCRGSHTHSVVSAPGDDGRIIVYNSGLRSVRDEDELPGCIDTSRYGDERTAMFRIDVIEIPVDRPQDARVVGSPAVFADPETGALGGLWAGGDHGEDTQETNQTNHCHDITVFPSRNLAAGACSGNGILFDISDPLNPKRIHEVVDPGFAYWHSATFNNDGTKVLFTDEWGGGSRARCRASDPLDWGANAIYDIVQDEMEFRGYFKMPAPQSDEENCVAHNGAIVPVPGRDLFVQAWYQGGLSVIDFTDSANPVEIAWFDRGPVDAEDLTMGGYWSVYWFNGLIYGSEIARGLDVLRPLPSELLSEAEIKAAGLAEYGGVFNPQQQFPVTWPAEPAVARALLHQFQREGRLDQRTEKALSDWLDRAERGDVERDQARRLHSMLSGYQERHKGLTYQRLTLLRQVIDGIVADA